MDGEVSVESDGLRIAGLALARTRVANHRKGRDSHLIESRGVVLQMLFKCCAIFPPFTNKRHR